MEKYCFKCGSILYANKIDGQDRLCCLVRGCNYVFWDNPIPVVAAIVELVNQTVILAHNRSWGNNVYGLITGFLEKREKPADAILREIKEEINLQATYAHFLGHYVFEEMNQLIIAYHVKASGIPKISNDEIDSIKCIPIDKLKPWSLGTGPVVRDWLASLNKK